MTPKQITVWADLMEVGRRHGMNPLQLARLLVPDHALPSGERAFYSDEFKRSVVARVLAGEETVSAIARETGVASRLLRRWTRETRYRPEGVAAVPRYNSRSTAVRRQEVADAVILDGLSKAEVAADFGLALSTVYDWVNSAPHVPGGARVEPS